jgi:hypothetical protein
VLLTPANLERPTDVEVEAIRSAAAKLALHAPVADAVATPLAEAVGSIGSGACGDGVDAVHQAELADDGTSTETDG